MIICFQGDLNPIGPEGSGVVWGRAQSGLLSRNLLRLVPPSMLIFSLARTAGVSPVFWDALTEGYLGAACVHVTLIVCMRSPKGLIRY